jgi:hypothetical protein
MFCFYKLLEIVTTSVIIAAIPTQHLFAPHLGSFTELVDFFLFLCWWMLKLKFQVLLEEYCIFVPILSVFYFLFFIMSFPFLFFIFEI